MPSDNQQFITAQPLQVFLCYSSEDKPAIGELYLRLQADGVQPWFNDEDLLPGQKWRTEIPKAVRTADVVLICLSPSSVSRPGYVQTEIKLALEVADEQPEGSISVIPVRLEECDVPDRIKGLHWANLFEEHGYERLMQALQRRADQLGKVIVSIPNEQSNKTDTKYDNWRKNQNEWFMRTFASERESRAQFGQPINVADGNVNLIERSEEWAKMDKWFQQWKTHPLPLVISGEEGDGKTWTTASWLTRNIRQNDTFPGVVFFASTSVIHQNVESLLVQAIARQLPDVPDDQVKQRLNRWMQRTEGDTPLILLVFDGINERHSPDRWRELLQSLTGTPWHGQVGVIVTCRTAYWQRYFGDLRSLPVVKFPIPPYTDRALDTALAQRNLRREDIPNNLLPIIRKPRYFDLMVRYRDRLTESGDMTIARLVYEDWRDRHERKVNTPLTNEQFQDVIRQLAETQQQRVTRLRDQDIVKILPVAVDQEHTYRALEELRTGGILTEKSGKYHVNEQLLPYGLGLLLVEQLEQAALNGDDLRETIAGWLEPHAEMDIKAAICEFAALHALTLGDIVQKIKVALLQAWVDSRNISMNTEETITAYMPLDTQAYVVLAEIVWSATGDNAWAQEILVGAFIYWYDKSLKVAEELQLAFERWLGFVPINGFPQREETRENVAKAQKEMSERVGHDLLPGPFSLGGFPLTVIENNGILRLGRAALAVISHVSRIAFVRAIAIGCLAEAIMGHPDKYHVFGWVLRTASEDIWTAVEREVQQLLVDGSVVAKQAAYRLLSYDGREQAYALRETIPETIFPPAPVYEQYLQDPCNSGFTWDAETCVQCLQRQDLSVSLVARQTAPHSVNPDLFVPDYYQTKFMEASITIDTEKLWIFLAPTSEDHTLETFEPILLRFAPHRLVDFVCSVAQQIRERRGMAQRQLSFRLNSFSLVFSEVEWRAVDDAWHQLVDTVSTWEDPEETTEYFLYRLLFLQGTAEDHITAMLRRPDHLLEETINRQNFLPVNDWATIQHAFTQAVVPKITMRILWYLSAHPSTVSYDLLRDHIIPLLSHESSHIRSLVLEIIYRAGNEAAVHAVVTGPWCWSQARADGEEHYGENHWGSLILCEYGVKQPIADIVRRVHPSYIGHAVLKRGNRTEEVEQYAHIIHNLWIRLNTEAPDIPNDLPDFTITSSIQRDAPRMGHRSLQDKHSHRVTFFHSYATWGGVSPEESSFDFNDDGINSFKARQEQLWQIVHEAIKDQEAVGNFWFSDAFYPEDLNSIIETYPEVVEEWTEAVLKDKTVAARIVHRMSSFYHALCIALMDTDPPLAIRLYWRIREIRYRVQIIDYMTRFEILDFALFVKLPNDIDIIRNAWQERLAACTSDKELMTVALLAQYGKGKDWLWTYITERLLSQIPIERARALSLLGFIDEEKARTQLDLLLQELPKTWLHDMAKLAKQRCDANAWAKHWFRTFLSTHDDIGAWAAFRLFLRCVDGRYLLWHDVIRKEVGEEKISAHRKSFLLNNTSEIRSSIRSNEKNLEEQLFGQKKQQRQVWPWTPFS